MTAVLHAHLALVFSTAAPKQSQPGVCLCSADVRTANGTRYQRAYNSDGHFWQVNFMLKSMMFCDVTNVQNKRKHLKMMIRSVPDSASLILG